MNPVVINGKLFAPRMFPIKDLSGRRFGKLVVLSIVMDRPDAGRQTYFWNCQCDCGKTKQIRGAALVHNHTKSCGHCTHGLSRTVEYSVWFGMKRKCFNKNADDYPNFGGRGIKMCRKWSDSFEVFLNDVGKRPSKEHSFERLNKNGDFNKTNCHWSVVRIRGPRFSSEEFRMRIFNKLGFTENRI